VGDIGCRRSACAIIVEQWGAVQKYVSKKRGVVGPHLILPSKVVPGDGMGRCTGFKKDYPSFGKGSGNICVS
jgi:hypothetical protein